MDFKVIFAILFILSAIILNILSWAKKRKALPKNRDKTESSRRQAEFDAAVKQAQAEAQRKNAAYRAELKQAELEEARKQAELEEARKQAELEEARKQAELEEAKKQAELEELERIAELEAENLAAETPFKISADIAEQYAVMNKTTLIDHSNRRKIYEDSENGDYSVLESMSLVFIGSPAVFWYGLRYYKSGEVYCFSHNEPIPVSYLESLTAAKLFEYIASALKGAPALFNDFVSDERVINWCACVREYGKELDDIAATLMERYHMPFWFMLFDNIRGPGEMNYLYLYLGSRPGLTFHISYYIQFGHTDAYTSYKAIPNNLLTTLTVEKLMDLMPSRFGSENELLSDERVIKWCEFVREYGKALITGTEAKARRKKLKEYQTYTETAGKLPEEFHTVKNIILEAMHEQAKGCDENEGDICMSLFLQIKDGFDIHSALKKIIQWKKNYIEYDIGYSWEEDNKIKTGMLSASNTDYRQQTMILTEYNPDITDYEIQELKELNITLCRLIGGTAYYDWLDHVVYMYDYSKVHDKFNDGAINAYWYKEVIAVGDAALNMLQEEIEKEHTVTDEHGFTVVKTLFDSEEFDPQDGKHHIKKVTIVRNSRKWCFLRIYEDVCEVTEHNCSGGGVGDYYYPISEPCIINEDTYNNWYDWKYYVHEHKDERKSFDDIEK